MTKMILKTSPSLSRAFFLRAPHCLVVLTLSFGLGGSHAFAQQSRIVSQYQYVVGTSDSALTSDWFAVVNSGTAAVTATPGLVYPSGSGVYVGSSGTAALFTQDVYSNRAAVAGSDSRGVVYNYTSKAAITNASPLYSGANTVATGSANFGTGGSPPSGVAANRWVAGAGLGYIVQNQNNDFGVNGGNFRIRNQNAEFEVTGASSSTPAGTSTGITSLVYSAASSNVDFSAGTVNFSFRAGTNGTNPNTYSPGFRAAIQDTNNQWWLSNWATGTWNGTPAWAATGGVYTLNMNTGESVNGFNGSVGTTAGFAAYTPADINSSTLALFDAASATFTPFTGTAKAFGFFFGQNTGNIGYRVDGFQVTQVAAVPEPASMTIALVGLGCLFVIRATRRASTRFSRRTSDCVRNNPS